jgi:hypothetical protein
MTTQISDFDIQDAGSFIVLYAISSAAVDWCAENLPDDAQQWADGTVIEHRYFEPIYHGIIADGLTIS